MFVVGGQAQGQLSLVGPLAVGVPGALAAYHMALEEYGLLELSQLLLPAAEIAERGFVIDDDFATLLHDNASLLNQFSGTRNVLFKSDGEIYASGDTLRQPDLAAVYRAVAEHGPRWFYKGPFAQAVADWMSENGGILTMQDLAEYRAKPRTPISSTYRGYTLFGFPPPSSGGVHVAQILNILEHFDLAAIFQKEPAEAYHIVAEAMKIAFADRARWLGDADFAAVPRGLVDKTYATSLAKKIDRSRVTDVPNHGYPPDWQSDLFGKHTTHVAAADSRGNWVALTATVNTSFGSKVIVPGTGVVLNNEMDDFSIQPGTANAFGLVGAENNSIAPGKRPLSSMSPTIVLQDGQPILTLGAAGGPRIITQVVWTIVNQIDFGRGLAESLAAGRIHHQWLPIELSVEDSVPDAIVQQLEQRGHRTSISAGAGVTQAIGRRQDGRLIGFHDPRVAGKTDGL